MNTHVLIICADVNDGDYSYSLTEFDGITPLRQINEDYFSSFKEIDTFLDIIHLFINCYKKEYYDWVSTKNFNYDLYQFQKDVFEFKYNCEGLDEYLNFCPKVNDMYGHKIYEALVIPLHEYKKYSLVSEY